MRPLGLILLSCVFTTVSAEPLEPPKVSPAEKFTTVNLSRIAEQIRNGEIDVGKDYSTNVKTGRFHIIHADKLLIDCNTCHYGSQYKADYQLMSKHKPMPDKMPGRLQRSGCIGCHAEGGMATHLYGRSATW